MEKEKEESGETDAMRSNCLDTCQSGSTAVSVPRARSVALLLPRPDSQSCVCAARGSTESVRQGFSRGLADKPQNLSEPLSSHL